MKDAKTPVIKQSLITVSDGKQDRSTRKKYLIVQNNLRKAIKKIVTDLERGNLLEFPAGSTEGKL